MSVSRPAQITTEEAHRRQEIYDRRDMNYLLVGLDTDIF